jgi:hypothetical protein
MKSCFRKSKIQIRSLNFSLCVTPVHKLVKYVIAVPKLDLGLNLVRNGSCPHQVPVRISRKPPVFISFQTELVTRLED